jgi:hypothetical protein
MVESHMIYRLTSNVDRRLHRNEEGRMDLKRNRARGVERDRKEKGKNVDLAKNRF